MDVNSEARRREGQEAEPPSPRLRGPGVLPYEALPRPAPAWASALAWLGVAVGAGAFAAGVRAADPAPAWRALLVNFLFWVSVAQGAVIWSAIFRITRTSWSAPINRIGHSASAFLPFCLAAFVGLIAGRAYLLPWLGHDMGDRAVWLNARGLFIRDGIGLLVLLALSWVFVHTYLKVDMAGEPGESSASATHERANHRLSVVGAALLFAYGVVFSLLGFDLVMSLMPEWHSALFGWYFALGGLYVGMAWLVIVAVAAGACEPSPPVPLSKSGEGGTMPEGTSGTPRAERIGTTELRNLGNLMLACAMLMTYFLYSQALPIWYENLPHEVGWAMARVHHQPWQALCWVLIFTCYLGVFALLVVREMKEKPAALMGVALLVLASMWLERYMLVIPSLAPEAAAFPILGVLIGIGFLGGLVLTTMRFLARYPAVSALDLALLAEREKWE